jgi:thiamine-phosphate pyrophosphorylase
MAGNPTFRWIAIYDGEMLHPDAPHASKHLNHWLESGVKQRADAVYLRMANAPEDYVQRASTMVRAFGLKLILPAALMETGHADAWHYRASDPAQPLNRSLSGKACHGVADVKTAAANGFSYALLSPIYATETHPEASPLGLLALREACKAVRIPVFALGGIGPDNLANCLHAGAHGVAAIRMFLR